MPQQFNSLLVLLLRISSAVAWGWWVFWSWRQFGGVHVWPSDGWEYWIAGVLITGGFCSLLAPCRRHPIGGRIILVAIVSGPIIGVALVASHAATDVGQDAQYRALLYQGDQRIVVWVAPDDDRLWSWSDDYPEWLTEPDGQMVELEADRGSGPGVWCASLQTGDQAKKSLEQLIQLRREKRKGRRWPPLRQVDISDAIMVTFDSSDCGRKALPDA